MITEAHAIDYASVDEDKVPDTAAAVAAGVVAVQIRAEYDYGARPFEDGDWHRDHEAWQKAGMLVGPYVIVNWLDGVEPEARISQLVKIVGALDPRINLVPAFDIEFPRGILGTTHTRAQIMVLVRKYVKALRDAFGVWPELYDSGRVWNTLDTDTLGNPPAPDLTDCSQWCAHYPVSRGLAPINPSAIPSGLGMHGAPNPWGYAWKHQYQGDTKGHPGFSSTVDLTRFNYARLSNVGPQIGWLNRRLDAANVLLAKGPSPLVFDDMCDARVRSFQTRSGLPADGVVGFGTHNALNWIRL